MALFTKDYGVTILRFGMREIRRYPHMPILRCHTASWNESAAIYRVQFLMICDIYLAVSRKLTKFAYRKFGIRTPPPYSIPHFFQHIRLMSDIGIKPKFCRFGFILVRGVQKSLHTPYIKKMKVLKNWTAELKMRFCNIVFNCMK